MHVEYLFAQTWFQKELVDWFMLNQSTNSCISSRLVLGFVCAILSRKDQSTQSNINKSNSFSFEPTICPLNLNQSTYFKKQTLVLRTSWLIFKSATLKLMPFISPSYFKTQYSLAISLFLSNLWQIRPFQLISLSQFVLFHLIA